jgi:hypothetical protein
VDIDWECEDGLNECGYVSNPQTVLLVHSLVPTTMTSPHAFTVSSAACSVTGLDAQLPENSIFFLGQVGDLSHSWLRAPALGCG